MILILIFLTYFAFSITERDALMKLYSATKGNSWRYNGGWNSDADICQWAHITCNSDGSVTGIQMEKQLLDGRLPKELSQLTALTSLIIQRNENLKGEIPVEIITMPNLEVLNLYGNALGGNLPREINDATKLRSLELEENNFEGSMPSVAALTSLTSLSLGGNKGLNGPVPDLSSLSKLKRLSLHQNQFTGELPVKFHWPSLEHLYADQNKFSGNLPDNFGDQLPNLQDLYISKNKFTGSLPTSIKKMTKLKTFYCFENGFEGQVPDMSGWRDLIWLNIGFNKFEGNMPKLGHSKNLFEYDITKNSFSGSLPAEHGSLAKLNMYKISNNQITGTIPSSFRNLADIEIIHFGSNELLGPIPDWSQNIWFTDLQLHNNQFCGVLPEWIVNSENLLTLKLANNRWSCPIPNYCDGNKKACDYDSGMTCESKTLVDPNTCTFEEATSTTTAAPTTTTTEDHHPGGEVFTTRVMYKHSLCDESEPSKHLHDTNTLEECAQEAHDDHDCDVWFSSNPTTGYCVCILEGGHCHKVSADAFTNVYRIFTLAATHHEENQDLERRFPTVRSRSPLVWVGVVVAVFLIGSVASNLCFWCQRKQSSLDELLVDLDMLEAQ